MPLEGPGVPLVLSGVMMRDAFLGITRRARSAWTGREGDALAVGGGEL